jgi:hypothetical protein
MQPYDFIGLMAGGSSPEARIMSAEDVIRLGHRTMVMLYGSEHHPSASLTAYLEYVQSHYPDILGNS